MVEPTTYAQLIARKKYNTGDWQLNLLKQINNLNVVVRLFE